MGSSGFNAFTSGLSLVLMATDCHNVGLKDNTILNRQGTYLKGGESALQFHDLAIIGKLFIRGEFAVGLFMSHFMANMGEKCAAGS